MTTANDYGIRREWAQAWAWTERHPASPEIANDLVPLALHLLAALMEERFKSEHFYHDGQCDCRKPDKIDPRHDYDQAAWLAAARAKLEELGR